MTLPGLCAQSSARKIFIKLQLTVRSGAATKFITANTQEAAIKMRTAAKGTELPFSLPCSVLTDPLLAGN